MECMALHDPAQRPAFTHDSHGHIELERNLDSITIGMRHRAELGDLKPLVDSIEHLGLLQPITITPDGLLICGRRRLEAVRRLGWRTVRVWVRAGISDELTRLVAEQDENATHKPLAPMEAARLFRGMRKLMREDAARRRQATRFGAPMPAGVGSGSGESPEPVSRHALESRVQAAKFVTGRDSHQQLERICEMERIAADRAQPAAVRKVAEDELAHIRNGGSRPELAAGAGDDHVRVPATYIRRAWRRTSRTRLTTSSWPLERTVPGVSRRTGPNGPRLPPTLSGPCGPSG